MASAARDVAEIIARNRFDKAIRIAHSLAKSWEHIRDACIAEKHPAPTFTDLANAIEKKASTAPERFRFSLCLFVSEEASRETWRIVVAIIREWADSDARVLAFEARR